MTSSSSAPAQSTHATLMSQWDTTKDTLERQLQHAIDEEDGDMTEAIASVQELNRLWPLISESSPLPHRPTRDLVHDGLENALKLCIEDLGKAVTRTSSSNRSAASRILRLPLDTMRRSPQECLKEALKALNSLHALQYPSEAGTKVQPTGKAWPMGPWYRMGYPHGHGSSVAHGGHSAGGFDSGIGAIFGGGDGGGGGGGAVGGGGGC